MRHFILILFTILLSTAYANDPSQLRVVVSIAPLNAITAGVLAGISEPTLLVPPQASHHHYTLKPSDAQALSQANVLIWLGPDLEIFLEKMIANLNKNTTVISIEKLPGLTLYPVRDDPNWGGHQGHDHSTSHHDPHLWLDPQNAIVIAKALADIFSQVDLPNTKYYHQNATNMAKQIQTVDDEIKKELAPVQQKPFLVFHDGYQYFEKHYQLNSLGSITIDPDLPPSAQRVYQLHREIEQEHIECVFAEPGVSSAIINTLQRDTHIRVEKLDTMGKGHHFSDYLDLLKFDAAALIKCLQS